MAKSKMRQKVAQLAAEAAEAKTAEATSAAPAKETSASAATEVAPAASAEAAPAEDSKTRGFIDLVPPTPKTPVENGGTLTAEEIATLLAEPAPVAEPAPTAAPVAASPAPASPVVPINIGQIIAATKAYFEAATGDQLYDLLMQLSGELDELDIVQCEIFELALRDLEGPKYLPIKKAVEQALDD